MTAAIFAGLVLGGIYGLAATGVVVTYVTAGVMNLGYASVAFFVARLYYQLLVVDNWSIPAAAIVAILVVGPAIGLAMWFFIFRFMRLASTLIKIVVTLGLGVAIPPIAVLLFGNQPIVAPPGLAPQPEHVFHLLGANITLDQVIVYICVVAVIGIGALVLRFTDFGLVIRASVDSEAMASISGVKSSRIGATAWVISTFLAGLIGVLIAPIIGLEIDAFTVLIAAAFTAVVAAKLTNVKVALVVGILMGLATSLVEYWLPSNSSFTGYVIAAIPFLFILIFLLYFVIRQGGLRDSQTNGGPLDTAIAPQGGSELELARAAHVTRDESVGRSVRRALPIIVVVAVLAFILQGVWIGALALGIAYAIVFLSWRVVVGEAGIIWLCQITFAGIGAYVTAELASRNSWPLLLAIVAGGLVAGAMGLALGALTVRLGDLYVALATVTFGLLVSTVFIENTTLSNYGQGIAVSPPSYASSTRAYIWFGLVIFCVLALLVDNMRRSTFGLTVSASRWSEPGARTSGVRVVRTKVFLSAFAAFIAGVGGGVLAPYFGSALPDQWSVFTGLTWLAVLVTVGIQSNIAALVAGLSFSFLPQAVSSWLPVSWGEVPPALFGLGAVFIARNPEGTLAMQVRQGAQLFTWVGDKISGTKTNRVQTVPEADLLRSSVDPDMGALDAASEQTAGVDLG